MGKRVRTTGYRARLSDLRIFRLPFLCVVSSLGAVLGCVLAQLLGGDSDLALRLHRFAMQEASGMASVYLLSAVLLYFRYPLIVLLLCHCSYSPVVIPLSLAAFGFTISFSTASLAAALGRQGVLLALSAFGIRSLLVLICVLYLSLWGFEKKDRKDEIKQGAFGNVFFVCLLLLTVGVMLELTVVPKLVSLALAACR